MPFLFNMKAAEAAQRYIMALANETKTHYWISVVPRLQVDQEAFSKAVHRAEPRDLPAGSDRFDLARRNQHKDYNLSEINKPNAPVHPSNFKGTDLGPPWVIVRNPDGDAPPPRAAAKEAPKRQAPAGPLRRAAGDDRRAPNN